MTKKHVMAGFKFADVYDAGRLRVWLDDDKMDTPRRKALVIVGPKGCGKSTLLRRIAKYKGEEPCYIAPTKTGHILNRDDSFKQALPVLSALQDRKLVLMDDLEVRHRYTLSDTVRIADGTSVKIRRPRSFCEVLTYQACAVLAVSVSANDAERVERWIGEYLDCCNVFSERVFMLRLCDRVPAVAKR